MNEETMKGLKKLFAIKWAIYLALVMSIFIYFIVCVFLKKADIRVINDDSVINILKHVFSVTAAVMILVAFYVRRNTTDTVKFTDMLKRKNFAPEMIERFLSATDDANIKRVGGVILLSNTLDIISWTLLEGVGILGLVLFMLSGNILYVQVFGGAALLALAFSRPNYSNFLALIEAVQDEQAKVE